MLGFIWRLNRFFATIGDQSRGDAASMEYNDYPGIRKGCGGGWQISRVQLLCSGKSEAKHHLEETGQKAHADHDKSRNHTIRCQCIFLNAFSLSDEFGNSIDGRLQTKYGFNLSHTQVTEYRGETILLHGIRRGDSGVVYCIANNGYPPLVSRQFHLQVNCENRTLKYWRNNIHMILFDNENF